MADNIKNDATAMMIQVDDGIRRIPITNSIGQEIGVFFFRPTDMGIIDRYNRMMEQFDDVLKPLENASIGTDGKAADPTDEETAAAIAKATENLSRLLDELFDGNFAEAFFGKMNPFSPVGGKFYCEGAIEAVGNFIEAAFGTEVEAMSKRTQKYTAPYQRRGRK